MNLIDTHQHLLYPDRFEYAWCRNLPALAAKPFRLEEYRVAAKGTGISGTLFMEVDVPEPGIAAETKFFLELAAQKESGILGVIGSCRPEHESFPAELEAVLHPKLKGLRRVLHVMPDGVSQQPTFYRNLRLLARHRLTFDICMLARQLPMAIKLVENTPDVQFVLDHCGVPDIKSGVLEPWRSHIRGLAQFPNLACKISGLVAYCPPEQVSAQAIRPYVEHCIECFGWDRVIFGGDWPVCNLTSSLSRWVELARELVARESAANQEKFFAGNARRIYRLT